MRKISRRNFLLASGAVTISAALSACGFYQCCCFLRSRILCSRFRCACFRRGQGAEYLVLERRVPGPLQ